jgi:hypothetical protein
MMKVGPLEGILALILGLMIVTFGFWYIFIYAPPPTLIAPQFAMARDEGSPDYTLNIVRLSEPVKISDVELGIIYKENRSAFKFDLEDIVIGNHNDDRNNIIYYDHMNDGKLSSDDSLVLKIDHDGSNYDGNNDGDFTNDGPFSNGDTIKLMHKKIGGTMCAHIIDS